MDTSPKCPPPARERQPRVLCEDRAMRTEGSSALVTGGASGLGAGHRPGPARAGRQVVIATCPAAEVAPRLGDRVTFAAADVADPEQVGPRCDTAADAGRCASRSTAPASARPAASCRKDGPHALDAFARVIEVNLIGTFNVIRLAAAAMASDRPDGRRRARRDRQHRLRRRLRRPDRPGRLLRRPRAASSA